MSIFDILKTEPKMSILHKLKTDHEKVRKILDHAEKIIDKYPKVNEAQEIELARKLLKELEPHSKAEEEIFYKALRKKEEAKLEPYEGLVEHRLALELLKTLQRKTLKKTERTAKIKVLKELILHHIKEEEGQYFKTAKKCFTPKELEELGKKFSETKTKIIKLKKY